MKNKYLIRLDDACPTMNHSVWQKVLDMLDFYGIHPMIGIIPHNEDPLQQIDVEDYDFWRKVKIWEQKGYAIALHGYNHCYISNRGLSGLNPLWSRSEFSGVSLELQKEKIHKGLAIFREHDIEPKYFFAPSHTFDENTLIALREESNIRIISDTIATKPYKFKDFIFIPQLGGRCIDIKIPGIWTFCLHPSVMSEEDFIATELFIKSHIDEFIEFEQLDLSNLKGKNIKSKLLSFIYFLRRRLKS